MYSGGHKGINIWEYDQTRGALSSNKILSAQRLKAGARAIKAVSFSNIFQEGKMGIDYPTK